MDHVTIEKVLTSLDAEYRIVREDGMILATTYSQHYAEVIKNAIEDDIKNNDEDDIF